MADGVLATYAPVGILIILAFVVVWATLALTKLVAPRRPSPSKLTTYESGEVPLGNARGPIDVQYYLYILVFLIIDIEAVFLIPWALNYVPLGTTALVEMIIFAALVLFGWAYAWKKGALEWQS
ncbi:MAG TPA: NADH-quinone oxidoreductase subunit A [Candidatus Thermoplasmatota archaeon]|nr:NADH-quinone oxidoreductase subunit A [Candidatus Thermoplasmatota archaeon]